MTNLGWASGHRRAGIVLACLALSLALTGCGSPLVPASGKLKYKGEPVKGGTLTFSPVGEGNPGKPASAEVGKDGAFTLMTYKEGDGAAVGKYKVIYTAPEPELTEEQRKNPNYHATPSMYAGMEVKQTEVEIKAGENTLNLDLVVPPKKMP